MSKTHASKFDEFYEVAPVAALRLNPDNPRTITEASMARLMKSIKEFPLMLEYRPVIVDEDGMALGGNMRLLACMKLGIERVPVLRVKGLTREQKRELVLRDNHHEGEWDTDILKAKWSDAPLADWGAPPVMELPAFGRTGDTGGGGAGFGPPTPPPMVEIVCPHCGYEYSISEEELL